MVVIYFSFIRGNPPRVGFNANFAPPERGWFYDCTAFTASSAQRFFNAKTKTIVFDVPPHNVF
jgi:hypothetical protein